MLQIFLRSILFHKALNVSRTLLHKRQKKLYFNKKKNTTTVLLRSCLVIDDQILAIFFSQQITIVLFVNSYRFLALFSQNFTVFHKY